MKTRQLPSATTTVSYRAKQRDLGGRPAGVGMPCERERKHEAAMREREEQMKRERAAAAAAAAAQRVRLHNRKMNAEEDHAKRRISHPKDRLQAYRGYVTGVSRGLSGTRETGKTGESGSGARMGKSAKAAAAPPQDPNDDPDECDAKAERLRKQLEELAALSEDEFEVKFRQWLDQEGIAREMHSHLRVELIHCFNNTALGQLLSKAAGVQMAHSHSLLVSPLAMVLHTLVAEFLHSQNCHFTLSVFCSETPHRQKLPDFSSRPEFRFRPEELQQVLIEVLGGEEASPDPELSQITLTHYEEDLAGQTQCLLMALMRALLDIRRDLPIQMEDKKDQTISVSLQDSSCQTEPSACLEVRPEVDTTGFYQAEENELFLGADGRSVFVGGRVSQSLHSVENLLNQLMKNLRFLAKSCAPPVEVISPPKLEDLLKKELRERERLLKAGKTFDPGKSVTKLASEEKVEGQKSTFVKGEDDVVQSEVGPILLPALDVPLPRLPRLRGEQLASLATIRQSLEKIQKRSRQPQGRMYVSMERMETLMNDVCGSVRLLVNVLNLSMEQEHSVGEHKGFKEGYREGFAHGHFMGLQEGQMKEQCDQMKRERERERSETSVQVDIKIPTKSRATQASRRSARKANVHTQTDQEHHKDACQQANLSDPKPMHRSYEQWIHEMLHSSSGQVFLERVELSLNKAMDLQKARLDELFQVKLRHQAEMVRLSRRQNTWRTLCKRVERDSSSTAEARELVQKIFGLLEHYEAHHQQLAEKIQQTEIAAEQEARIMPMWTEGGGNGSAPGNTNSPLTSSGISTPKPAKNCIEEPIPTAAMEVDNSHATVLGYRYQLLAVAPPEGIPVTGTLVPVKPRHSVHFAKDLVSPSTRKPVRPSNIPAEPSPDHPITIVNNNPISEEPLPRDSQPVENPAMDPSSDSPRAAPKSSLSPREPSPPGANVAPSTASTTAIPIQPTAETELQPVPPASDPPMPSTHSVATNTMTPLPLKLTPLTTSPGHSVKGPSFADALLSAKSRMLQLEQESDLLERSFLSCLEKTKSKTFAHKSTEEPPKNRRIRSGCLREREQINRTMDGLRDWHGRIRKEDRTQVDELQNQITIPGTMLDSTPPWLSELEDGHEQNSYPFTNAISEARNKFLGKIMPIEREEKEAEEKQVVRTDWLEGLPSEVPELLKPTKPQELDRLLTDITPDLTRSSSNGEISLLLQRAKMALGFRASNPLLDSSSSSSSMELPSMGTGRSPSTKFQASMAKMQLLFGAADPVKPAVSSIPPKPNRPVSAPTAGSGSGILKNSQLPQRPHTAPTLSTIGEKIPPALSLDVSSSSSSESTLPERSAGKAFEALVTSAVAGGQHRDPDSSQEVSFSQAFWKRMNL